MTEMISVIGAEEIIEDTDRFFGSGQRRFERREIPVGELATRINSFLDALADVLAGAQRAVGGFEMTEVTVKAEISAKGTLSILGTGGEIGGSGGLEFKFVRKSKEQQD